jgi:4-amino-4-deoxy-L-arabinose transferase-like glycosyltransferase
MEAARRPSGRIVACAAALLLLFAALATWQAWSKSETYDEPMYIYTGYSYVTTGDLSLNREHPPLSKYLMALPLLALDLRLPPDHQQRAGNPLEFYARQPHATAHQILFLARLPGVLLGVALGLYVFRWARLLLGDRAALLALALYALNPNMIGHSVVATNDFCATLFCFAAVYHAWRWLETGARGSLALAAVTLGLAVGSKLTALLLLPVIGLMVAFTASKRRRPWLLAWAALALLAAGGVLWLLYGGEARSLADARRHARFTRPGPEGGIFSSRALEDGLQRVFGDTTPIPLLSFLKGIDHQRDHAAGGHQNYFHGRVSEKGSPVFYLVTFAIKNPEGLVLLLLLALVSLRRTRRGALAEAALWGFPLLVMVVFSRSDVQLGFKYVLPVLPFACVAASRVLAVGPDGAPAAVSRREAAIGAGLIAAFALLAYLEVKDADELRSGYGLPLFVAGLCAVRLARKRPAPDGTISPLPVASLLVLWASVSVLAQQPDNLMYFNGWVGGPDQGWRWSVIGDDWGQDTAGLARWMAEHGEESLHYDYYGEGDPEAWGVRSVPCWGGPKDFVPPRDLVAVPVSFLVRMPENYAWLAGHEPIAKIGHTIFLYDLREPAP